MKEGKFNIVVDGQFGSTSKGKIATYLVDRHNVRYITTTNMPNAGHVSVVGDVKFTGKALPSGAILCRTKDKFLRVFIGPSAGFTIDQLFKEMDENKLTKEQVVIHPRAGVVQAKHASLETSEMKHIGSTMQGCGAMLREKIKRSSDAKLARDFTELEGMVAKEWEFSNMIMDLMDNGATILHEGAQGFSLDIHHGHSYPFCLHNDSKVLLSDGTTVKIGELVRSYLRSEYGDENFQARETMNISNGKEIRCIIDGVVTTRPIIRVQRLPYDGVWYNVVTETSAASKHGWFGGKYTENHKITIKRDDELCSMKVSDIKFGDLVRTNENKIDGAALQIVLGSMLGDGTIPDMKKSPNRAQFSFSHGADQSSYCEFKATLVGPYLGGGVRDIITTESSFKSGQIHKRYESSYCHNVRRLAEYYGCFGPKAPNISRIVGDMDALGLAIWYMDDGQYKIHTDGKPLIFLHTQDFSFDECYELADALRGKFGLKFSVNKVMYRHGEIATYKPVLSLSRKSHDSWFELIGCYAHPALQHKFPFEVSSAPNIVHQPIKHDFERVISIEPVEKKLRYDSVCYNIEVADAHNFFVSNHHGFINVENCTSRQCTAATAMADLGIAPQYLGDIYLVIRAGHAIRVGNIKEGDKMVGFSGDVYPDQHEISWEDVKKDSGCPDDHEITELTTVTKRVRRVFTFSWFALKEAVRINGATKIAVNFANYLDWSCYKQKCNSIAGEYNSELPYRVRSFINRVQDEVGIPVTIVGTGPEHTEVVEFEG